MQELGGRLIRRLDAQMLQLGLRRGRRIHLREVLLGRNRRMNILERMQRHRTRTVQTRLRREMALPQGLLQEATNLWLKTLQRTITTEPRDQVACISNPLLRPPQRNRQQLQIRLNSPSLSGRVLAMLLLEARRLGWDAPRPCALPLVQLDRQMRAQIRPALYVTSHSDTAAQAPRPDGIPPILRQTTQALVTWMTQTKRYYSVLLLSNPRLYLRVDSGLTKDSPISTCKTTLAPELVRNILPSRAPSGSDRRHQPWIKAT